MLILLWYALSTVSNSACKVLLMDYGFLPITMTVVDLIPAFCMAIMDRRAVVTLIYTKYHKVSLIAISGLFASYLHRVALSVAHLSTVHSVKAVQPIFSALLCSVFFSENFTYYALFSLLAIVAGVITSTYRTNPDSVVEGVEAGEAFRLYGICSAVVSTFFLATSSVLSRRIATKRSVSQNTLYSASRILCVPVAIPVWTLFSDGFIASKAQNSSWSFLITLIAYLVSTLGQQLVSLATLVRVSAVSHAVLSSLKRVFVIVVAILFFGNKISSVNALGICIAAVGAWGYSTTTAQTKVFTEEEVSLIS